MNELINILINTDVGSMREAMGIVRGVGFSGDGIALLILIGEKLEFASSDMDEAILRVFDKSADPYELTVCAKDIVKMYGNITTFSDAAYLVRYIDHRKRERRQINVHPLSISSSIGRQAFLVK